MTRRQASRGAVPPCGDAGITLQALQRLCPGFVADGPAIRTETSLLIPGRIGARPVIAKHPIDQRAFWLQRCRHEIAVYQGLGNAGPLPVRFPELIAADPQAYLLIITRLPGKTIAPERYPARRPSPRKVELLLAALARLHAWRPGRRAALPCDDGYPAQCAGLNTIFSTAVLTRIQQLHADAVPYLGVQVTHGDPNPGNALLADHDVALIDLEVMAWRLPWFDHAMLWVLLGDHPATRAQLLAHVSCDPWQQVAFWLAAALICGREITSHQRHAPTPRHRTRLPRLRSDLETCLGKILHTPTR
jgi:hypothetical protein